MRVHCFGSLRRGLVTACAASVLLSCADGGSTEPRTVTIIPNAFTLTSIGIQSPLVVSATGPGMSSAVVTWASSAPQVATVAPNGVVTSVSNGTATITASALNATGTSTVTVAQVATSISVSPAAGTLGAIGATQQLTVVALDANNTAIAAPTVTWTSSAAAVATVSGTGLVTAVSNGNATITASVGSSSASATIAVAQVAATVTVTPTPVALASVGATQQLTALTRDANNNAIVDAAVVWSSSAPAAAAVSATGLVTAVANGATSVSASAAGVGGAAVVGTAEVTVAQVVTSVSVTPATATLASFGATQQLTGTARDANSNAVAGATIVWSSSTPATATVSAAGLVTAVANGSATITATAGTISGSAAITVAQTVSEVLVTPATATINTVGGTQQLTAAAEDANDNVIAGAAFTWTSSAQGVATVSAAGLVTAVANGAATITATTSGVNGTAAITVGQTVTVVSVNPLTATLTSFGATQQMVATATDGAAVVVAGATFTWASLAPSVATVNSSGLVTAVANGSATITATSGGVTGTRSVTVAQAVSSVSVTPTSASLARDGATRQLTAVARDANNNTIAGRSFSWSSNSTGVASVNSSGLVTSGNMGTATITASTGGRSATSTMTVTGVPMAWVVVTQVATAQYTPLASEGTNLSGGSITVARSATGRYAVLFGGLGTNAGRIGTNWTAMISTSLFQQAGLPVQGAVCNLNNLQVTELRVDVWCENAVTGAAIDAQFRVLVVGNGALAAPMAFTGHTNFSATANYTPVPSLAFSSGGEAQSVGVGASEIVHSYGANVPGNNGLFVQTITPSQGSARTCVVRANNPTARTATIWCFNAVGTRDRNITHLFMAPSLGRVGGFYGWAAVNSNGSFQFWRSTGGSVVTARVGVGSYTVTFNGLQTPGLDFNFAVLVSSTGGSAWENCGHRVSNPNPITVQIVCVNNAGTQIDVGSAFHVMVLR